MTWTGGRFGSTLAPDCCRRLSDCCLPLKYSKTNFLRRYGGLVVRVPASTSPIPGSKLGPGPLHSVVLGAADSTVNSKIPYKYVMYYKLKPYARIGL